MHEEWTTIRIKKETRNSLFKLKEKPEENYDTVIEKLLKKRSV